MKAAAGAAAAAVGVAAAAILSGCVGISRIDCFANRNALQLIVTAPAAAAVAECQPAEGVGQLLGPVQLLEERRTAHQLLQMRRHPFFGCILMIDGTVQVVEHDEANYHEMAAHVPMVYLVPAAAPLAVLVIGGGDGGAALRFLQYNEVAALTLVDIDQRAMRELSAAHMPSLEAAFRDPRALGVEADAAVWVAAEVAAGRLGRFDAVLVDVTDCAGSMELQPGAVTEQTLQQCGGASAPLFGAEFYTKLRALMSPRSVLIRNLDSPSWDQDSVAASVGLLRRTWQYCSAYHLHQPSFLSGHYAFAFCSDTVRPSDPVDWPAWERRGIATEYYTPDVHYASFALPARLAKAVGGPPGPPLRPLPAS